MILITLTMGELVSAFPMTEPACSTVWSPQSFTSWHAVSPCASTVSASLLQSQPPDF